MVRIAICDDNQSDRQALKELICTIAGYRRKGDVCFWEYSDSRQLLYDLQDGRALELLFLDIYLGGELGMDAARTIRSETCCNSSVIPPGLRGEACRCSQTSAR